MKKLLALSLLLIVSMTNAQNVLEEIYNPEGNFYEIQERMRQYFLENGTGKGSGYKQYKRWEYFVEPKVYPSGDLSLINSNRRFKEMERWENSFVPTRSISANFQEVGKTSWVHSNSWNPGMGRVNHVAVLPSDSNVIFVCAASGGLWKSPNMGADWECISDGLNIDATSVLVIDPNNETTMFLASGDRDGGDGASNGVFVTHDGGATWEQTALTGDIVGGRIYDLVMHPSNSNRLYAGTTSGLFESTDGGASWTETFDWRIKDIAFKPQSDSIMYIIQDYRFYKSTDSGATWTETTDGVLTNGVDRVLIAVTEANPEYVYYLYSNGSLYGGLRKSVDGGESFETISTEETSGNMFGYSPTADDDAGQAWYDMAICVSNTNAEEVHIGGVLTWKSNNGGVDWENTSVWTYPNQTGYNHADIHYLEYIGEKLYVTSDGGIFVSEDNGDNWTDLSQGLGIAQYYRFDIAPTDEIRIVAGAQDNGTTVYNNGEWLDWLGADGMDCAINYNNIDIIYGSSQNGYFYKTDNGGWNSIADVDGSVEGPWVTPLTMDPNDPEIIYAGNEQVHISENGMVQWGQISSFTGSTNVKEIAVAKYFSNVIYVARGNKLYRTDDFGIEWDLRSIGVPNQNISYVTLDPEDKDHVFICLSGYSEGNKVFESYDGGLTWENISANLPNLSCNSIAFHDNGYDALYLGMERGVYYYDKLEERWYDYSNGMPYVNITEVKIHEPSNSLYVATYGRGIWKTDLHQIQASENDLSIVGVIDPVGYYCGEGVIPSMKVKNRGSNPITSFSMSYELDGQVVSSDWQGNLASTETMDLVLSAGYPSNGEHNIVFYVNSVNDGIDGNNINDTVVSSFTFTHIDTNQFTVIIQPDEYASEISYLLFDSSGDTIGNVLSVGEDGDLTPNIQTYPYDGTCFDLQVNDGYGDGFCCDYGNGYVLVVNQCGDTLVHSGAQFGSQLNLDFCPDDFVGATEELSLVELFPNPSTGQLYVNSNSNIEHIVVYDNVGRQVYSYGVNSSLHNYPIDLSGKAEGVYYVILKIENEFIKKKIIIQK